MKVWIVVALLGVSLSAHADVSQDVLDASKQMAQEQGLETNDNWHQYWRVDCNAYGDCWVNDIDRAISLENLPEVLPVWVNGDAGGVRCPIDQPTCFIEAPNHSVGINPFFYTYYIWP